MNKHTAYKVVIRSGTAGMALVLIASILLPWLNRYRNDQNGDTASRNMNQIGLAILLYTIDNHGQYPDSLATLVRREPLSPKCLVNPLSDQVPASGNTPQEIERQIRQGGHQSVVYLAAGLTDKTATTQTVVAYDPAFDGCNVLRGDGSGVWLDGPQTRKMVSATKTTTLPAGILR
jgi:hypothetical protein